MKGSKPYSPIALEQRGDVYKRQEAAVAEAGAAVSGATATAMSEMVMSEAGCGKFVSEVGGVVVVSVLGFG